MTAKEPPKMKKYFYIYFLKLIRKNALTIDTTGAIIIIVAFCPKKQLSLFRRRPEGVKHCCFIFRIYNNLCPYASVYDKFKKNFLGEIVNGTRHSYRQIRYT